MFFRFGSTLVLLVLVSTAGVALEKRTLALRRSVSRQHYRMDVLRDEYAKMRLRTQQLAGPLRTVDALDAGKLSVDRPREFSPSDTKELPLLRWQRPVSD